MVKKGSPKQILAKNRQKYRIFLKRFNFKSYFKGCFWGQLPRFTPVLDTQTPLKWSFRGRDEIFEFFMNILVKNRQNPKFPQKIKNA